MGDAGTCLPWLGSLVPSCSCYFPVGNGQQAPPPTFIPPLAVSIFPLLSSFGITSSVSRLVFSSFTLHRLTIFRRRCIAVAVFIFLVVCQPALSYLRVLCVYMIPRNHFKSSVSCRQLPPSDTTDSLRAVGSLFRLRPSLSLSSDTAGSLRAADFLLHLRRRYLYASCCGFFSFRYGTMEKRLTSIHIDRPADTMSELTTQPPPNPQGNTSAVRTQYLTKGCIMVKSHANTTDFPNHLWQSLPTNDLRIRTNLTLFTFSTLHP